MHECNVLIWCIDMEETYHTHTHARTHARTHTHTHTLTHTHWACVYIGLFFSDLKMRLAN